MKITPLTRLRAVREERSRDLNWFLKKAEPVQGRALISDIKKVRERQITEMRKLFHESALARGFIRAMRCGNKQGPRHSVPGYILGNPYLANIADMGKFRIEVNTGDILIILKGLEEAVENKKSVAVNDFDLIPLFNLVHFTDSSFFSRFYWQLDERYISDLSKSLCNTILGIVNKYIPSCKWDEAREELQSVKKNIHDILDELSAISIASRGAIVLVDENVPIMPNAFKIIMRLHAIGIRRWLEVEDGVDIDVSDSRNCSTGIWLKAVVEKYGENDLGNLKKLHEELHCCAVELFRTKDVEDKKRIREQLTYQSANFMMEVFNCMNERPVKNKDDDDFVRKTARSFVP